jgi:putative transcriptional regulator
VSTLHIVKYKRQRVKKIFEIILLFMLDKSKNVCYNDDVKYKQQRRFAMKNRIKALRAERKMTQEQLAAEAGISRPALAQIENEKAVPDGKTIAALVKAIGVPANVIFLDLDVVCEQREAQEGL